MHDRVVTVKGSFLIIRPKLIEDQMPLACPICDVLMCFDDVTAWEKFACCNECADSWAYPNQTAWNSGWRPSKDILCQNVAKRSKIRINMNVL